MTGHDTTEALLEVLTPPLASSGLDLEGIEVSAAGRRKLVRVLVDSDAGVTLDDIAAATRLVSTQLDESDALGDSPYTLEVTSPGTDRPLTLPRHWRRNVDRLVKIQPREGGEFTGRILDASDDAATVDVEGVHQHIAYSAVDKARIEIEFNRPSTRERSTTTEEE